MTTTTLGRQNPDMDLTVGWKYMLFSRYRRAVHERWEKESAVQMVIEIILGIMATIVSGTIGLLILRALIDAY